MKSLFKRKSFLVSIAVLVLLVGALAIAWLSSLYTLNRLTIRTVTPTQMAAAMREDEFWSTYRFNTLIFDGKVTKISSQNGTQVVGLQSNDRYGVVCDMASPSSSLKVGNSYKFEAEPYQAERQPQAVLVHDCINP